LWSITGLSNPANLEKLTSIYFYIRMKQQEKTYITNLSFEGIKKFLSNAGQPAFRFQQLIYWIYKKRVDSFDAMHNIPKEFRSCLKDNFLLNKLNPLSILESKNNDAVKFGFDTEDSKLIIESVLLIDGKRRSLCVSTQLGCGLGCIFCETGKIGFIRNCTLHEITGQIIAANDYLESHADKSVTNIIFMGMGEALSNFETLMDALKIIMDEKGFGLGGRRITVSTAGIIPSIQRLSKQNLSIKLAISLNAYNNEKRNEIMPVNRKYPLEELIKTAQNYSKIVNQIVTFEYVVIKGENDTNEAVTALVRLLKGVSCKLNLIPLNPNTDNTLSIPDNTDLDKFAKKLSEKGLTVTIRKSRGQDISGACGQLAGKNLK